MNQKSNKNGAQIMKLIKDHLPILLAGVLVVLTAVLLVIILLTGKKEETRKPTPSTGTTATAAPVETTAPTEAELKEEVTEGVYFENAQTIAATLGEKKLSMGMLQMFYTSMVNEFLEEYGDSLSYVGLDITKSFKDQKYPYEDADTWEDFVLQLAVERWEYCITLRQLAAQEGFVVDQELYDMIDEQIAKLPEIASGKGYASATAMVQRFYGEACNVDIYREYLTLDTETNAYYYDVLAVTDEEVKTYFEENKETLAEKEITDNGVLVSDVRHILIYPKGGTLGEDGKTMVYTEDAWEACRVEAERIIAEWRSGAATEDSFIEMVPKYTEDTASRNTGGLYENVSNTGKYVEEFQNWAINGSRKPGDVEAVKTVFGYHIMYFVSGQQEYMYYSRILLQQDRLTAMGEKADAALEGKETLIENEVLTLQNIYETK